MKKLNATQLLKDNEILLESLNSKDRTIEEQVRIISSLKLKLEQEFYKRTLVCEVIPMLSSITEVARLTMEVVKDKK